MRINFKDFLDDHCNFLSKEEHFHNLYRSYISYNLNFYDGKRAISKTFLPEPDEEGFCKIGEFEYRIKGYTRHCFRWKFNDYIETLPRYHDGALHLDTFLWLSSISIQSDYEFYLDYIKNLQYIKNDRLREIMKLPCWKDFYLKTQYSCNGSIFYITINPLKRPCVIIEIPISCLKYITPENVEDLLKDIPILMKWGSFIYISYDYLRKQFMLKRSY